MKINLLLVPCLALVLSSSACLKTRAQLKDDAEDGPAKPVPAKVQDVEPKGEYVVDEIKSELTRMSGRIEDLERGQQQATANAAGANKDKEEVKKLELRMAELEQAQTTIIEQLKKLQEAPPVAADPGEIFEKGKNQYEAANYDGAIETLTSYLKTPKGKSAEQAVFLRAEAYYKLKQYKKAIVDYSKFPEKFTTSHHMSTALYKIGLSFEALGMKDDAKGFFQELVEKFPKSPEAKKVRAKLR